MESNMDRRTFLKYGAALAGCIAGGCSSLHKGASYVGMVDKPTIDGKIDSSYRAYLDEPIAISISPYIDAKKSDKGNIRFWATSENGSSVIPSKLYGNYCVTYVPNDIKDDRIRIRGTYEDGQEFSTEIPIKVIDESPKQKSYRKALNSYAYRTEGIVGILMDSEGNRIVNSKPGQIYFVGGPGGIIDPSAIRLTQEGYHLESRMDQDHAGERFLQDFFGPGSARLFKDRYGIVHTVQNTGMTRVPEELFKGDLAAPFKPIGNSIENGSLSLENTVEAMFQGLNTSIEDANRISRQSDSLNMVYITLSKSIPLAGDGWRRVHSFGAPGKMMLPVIGYSALPESPMHTHKGTMDDGILVYDEKFADKLNNDWAVSLDDSTKFWEITGAIAGDAGLFLILYNNCHDGGSSSSSTGNRPDPGVGIPGPINGPQPPKLPW